MPWVVNETYQQRPHQRYTLESLPQPLKKSRSPINSHLFYLGNSSFTNLKARKTGLLLQFNCTASLQLGKYMRLITILR